MVMENFARNLEEFETSLQKIATGISSGAISESSPPSDIWDRSASEVTSLQDLVKQVTETMLLLKPEKNQIIKKRFKAVSSHLNLFKEMLFQKTEDQASNVKRAIEELRKSVIEGSAFVELARDIQNAPSGIISEILKLREVYEAKEYLSAVFVPEAAYARLMVLRKRLKDLRSRMTSMERSLEDVKTHLDLVEEEIKKFRASPIETKEASEKTQS